MRNAWLSWDDFCTYMISYSSFCLKLSFTILNSITCASKYVIDLLVILVESWSPRAVLLKPLATFAIVGMLSNMSPKI